MYKYLYGLCLVSVLFSSSSSAMEADDLEAGAPYAGRNGKIWTALDEMRLGEAAQQKRQKAFETASAELVVLKRTIRAFREQLERPPSGVSQRVKQGLKEVKQAFTPDGVEEKDIEISDVKSHNIRELDPAVFASSLSDQFKALSEELIGLKPLLKPKDKEQQETFSQLTDSFLHITSQCQQSLMEVYTGISRVENPLPAVATSSLSSPIELPLFAASPVRLEEGEPGEVSDLGAQGRPKTIRDRLKELEKGGMDVQVQVPWLRSSLPPPVVKRFDEPPEPAAKDLAPRKLSAPLLRKSASSRSRSGSLVRKVSFRFLQKKSVPPTEGRGDFVRRQTFDTENVASLKADFREDQTVLDVLEMLNKSVLKERASLFSPRESALLDAFKGMEPEDSQE